MFGPGASHRFEREKWPPQTHETHCKQARKCLTAQTKNERKADQNIIVQDIQSCELPYYNAIRFAAIDGMRNLFLGTAKTTACIWKEKQILTKKDFDDIQCKITKMNAPIDIGRIPHKIEIGKSALEDMDMLIILFSLCSIRCTAKRAS